VTAAPLRAVIVDDEPLAREGLRMMLADHTDVEIVGEAGNGRAGLELVERVAPDLLLVDVQMPEVDGLELVARIGLAARIARPPVVVFVTAYDEYAIDAFTVHALDYVVKPVDPGRLAVALDRARGQHRLEALASGQPVPARRIPIRDGDRLHLVPVDKIDWIEAADYYVEVHAGERTYLHRESLARLEGMLGGDFVRIHRSRLVNQRRIREVRRDGRRELVVVLLNGLELAVARSQQSAVRALLNET
jgi:two-component system LytT family response regulator